ncbi:ethanolamine ammonia-lyase subunit EutC [Larsenimonas suaedae]|uniref:Ethanolamine ammonia-lyase small subunit n=1 Tax=Larsenimonas suaedae TaxID=1851019 RepID=A0ABU1GTG8_9GAMM|nr:ethanolamine ammonia-lyase subunit EutC [Larsenimonas suaedae]MCM2972412.1 ethanolamine ammonia-lyase subunit EutC [Larsenimonas suaedae]MDR5894792.1 ethanolamine ammonia-lyase subunit EutC [Larsenimonas suaedae]
MADHSSPDNRSSFDSHSSTDSQSSTNSQPSTDSQASTENHPPADDHSSNIVTDNPWQRLRQFTDARIGLGRAGISLPTEHLLEFQLAHARAQDAVHLPLDIETLCDDLGELALDAPIARLHSQATDRLTYLQRPDWGRRLDDDARERLTQSGGSARPSVDLAIAVVDGLSSFAIQQNAVAFLKTLLPKLAEGETPWSLAPLSVVEQGRVAIGDEIGECLNARAVLVLIGERPGLSSPDSLGLYFTWAPEVGLTDARRNCISNVRPAGLSFEDASRRLMALLKEAREKELSGVKLKDRSEDDVIEQGGARNFLTS